MALSLGELTEARATEAASWAQADASVLPRGAVAHLRAGDAVAVLDGHELVGVLVVGPLACPLDRRRASTATDVWLAVRPGRLHGGIATRAGELAIETLRVGGHTQLRATVPETSTAGIRLALRLGFAPVERVEAGDDTYRVLEREVLG